MATYGELDERYLADAMSCFRDDVRRYRESIKERLVFYSIGCVSTAVSGLGLLWYGASVSYLLVAIAAIFGFLAIRAQAMILGVDGVVSLYGKRIVSVPLRQRLMR